MAITMAIQAISHDRQDETIEAKALWFQSLSLAERMELLCAFTELLLITNPKIVEQHDAQPTARRVRILSAA
jgi:hypothetical protein